MEVINAFPHRMLKDARVVPQYENDLRTDPQTEFFQPEQGLIARLLKEEVVNDYIGWD